MPNGLDGCPVCTTFFTGREPRNYIVVLEGGLLMKKHQSLFMQDNPGNSHLPGGSHLKKPRWQWHLFMLLFKGIEIIWMVVQTVHYLIEILKP